MQINFKELLIYNDEGVLDQEASNLDKVEEHALKFI